MNKYLVKIAGLQENVVSLLDSHDDSPTYSEDPIYQRQLEDANDITHAKALLSLQGMHADLDPIQARKVIDSMSKTQNVGINGPALTRVLGAGVAGLGASIALGKAGGRMYGPIGGLAGMVAGGFSGGYLGNRILGSILEDREKARNQEMNEKREDNVYGAYATMADKLHRLGVV